MSVRILRWKGGAGGDMILYLKSLSMPGSVLNVSFTPMDKNGKTGLDFSKVNLLAPTELEKITLLPTWLDQVNLEKLSDEILKHQSDVNTVWLKSHYYKTDQFNNITIDIVVDEYSLPFLIAANVSKTNTTKLDFNPLISKIANNQQKFNYSMYCVAVDCMYNQQNVSKHTIPLSDLLVNVDTFDAVVTQHNIGIDSTFYNIYNDWLCSNLRYMPSLQYRKKVLDKDYNFEDPGLTLAEKYSLLVLAKKKFIDFKGVTC